MIVNLILNAVLLILGIAFSWLPDVDTLPEIAGYDIDTALVNGVGQFRSFIEVFWPLQTLFYGLIFLLGYYIIKNVVLRFFIGQRAG